MELTEKERKIIKSTQSVKWKKMDTIILGIELGIVSLIIVLSLISKQIYEVMKENYLFIIIFITSFILGIEVEKRRKRDVIIKKLSQHIEELEVKK